MSEDREVAKLAIMAAGQVGNDERAWQLRVAQLAMQIGSMLREPSPDHRHLATTPVVVARKVLDADVYRAEFVSISDEEMERTHRLLVRVRPEHGKPKYLDADGCEWLRTEPRWTNAGFVMQRMLRNLAPTTPILVFKYVEDFTSKGADEDEDKKSRVLAHLEVTGRPKSRQTEPRPVPQQAERAPVGGEAGGAVPPTAPPAESNPAITERLNKLKPAQMIALKNYCVGRDWSDWLNPGPDHIDGVLLALTKIENGEVLA